MLVIREKYLDKLSSLQDKRIIKVITGARRCGKSTLFMQFMDRLKKQGISAKQIQSYNFEDIKWQKTYTEVSDIIESKLAKSQMNYIFLDEVQNIESFEKLVDSLFLKKNTDIYITGSNAFLLSGELATLLTGRYIEIKVQPFSFREYMQLEGMDEIEKSFAKYLKNGGFPQSVEMFNIDESSGIEYLNSIFNSILVKDIIPRVGDSSSLEKIAKFLQDNIGNQTSVNKISNDTSVGYRKVEKYLDALNSSYLVSALERYNLKGREILKTGQKYYTIDVGLRRAVLGQDASTNRGHILENVVYLELLNRNYQVWSGQTKTNGEVDFVARNSKGDIEYFQVCETMMNEDTRRRELAALESIDDNNPKTILTRDYDEYNYDGVRQKNVVKWLLEKD